MKRLLVILAVFMFIALPVTAIAGGEGPMKLPAGTDGKAVMHNDAGIKDWGKGDFAGALGHFQESSGIAGSNGQTHFNEAICLDKLGKHGEATMHFKVALKNANGDDAIMNSPILKGHLGM